MTNQITVIAKDSGYVDRVSVVLTAAVEDEMGGL